MGDDRESGPRTRHLLRSRLWRRRRPMCRSGSAPACMTRWLWNAWNGFCDGIRRVVERRVVSDQTISTPCSPITRYVSGQRRSLQIAMPKMPPNASCTWKPSGTLRSSAARGAGNSATARGSRGPGCAPCDTGRRSRLPGRRGWRVVAVLRAVALRVVRVRELGVPEMESDLQALRLIEERLHTGLGIAVS